MDGRRLRQLVPRLHRAQFHPVARERPRLPAPARALRPAATTCVTLPRTAPARGGRREPRSSSTSARAITLCYERLGSESDPPLLLIMGLGQQLTAWPEPFVDGLVARGFQVIRFDNRDIGRSTHASNRPPRRNQLIMRRVDDEQYDLFDMARDTAATDQGPGSRPCPPRRRLDGRDDRPDGGRRASRSRSQPGLDHVLHGVADRRLGRTVDAATRVPSAGARSRRRRPSALPPCSTTSARAGSPSTRRRSSDRARLAFDRDPRAAAGTGRQMAAIVKAGDRTRELAADLRADARDPRRP